MANKIKLRVCGIEYLIVSDEDEAYLKSVAAKLDKEMEDTSHANPSLSTTMVAVLTALSYCDELTKAKEEINNLKMQLKNAVDDASSARFDSKEANREIERLSKVIKNIRTGTKNADD